MEDGGKKKPGSEQEAGQAKKEEKDKSKKTAEA